MGKWQGNYWEYDAGDIEQILEYGRTSEASSVTDAIEERMDVETAMKALKIKRGWHWENESYQLVADYLNKGGL